MCSALAAQFAGGGLLKLTGDTEMVQMFTQIEAGQWLRFLVGVLEVAGALGLLVPRLAGPAALGLVGLMIGATITNVTVLGTSPVLPAAFLLLSGLVVWARRKYTRRLAVATTRSANECGRCRCEALVTSGRGCRARDRGTHPLMPPVALPGRAAVQVGSYIVRRL